MIEVSNLSFRYREGAEPILRGIDLTVPDGSFVGITGAAAAESPRSHMRSTASSRTAIPVISTAA